MFIIFYYYRVIVFKWMLRIFVCRDDYTFMCFSFKFWIIPADLYAFSWFWRAAKTKKRSRIKVLKIRIQILLNKLSKRSEMLFRNEILWICALRFLQSSPSIILLFPFIFYRIRFNGKRIQYIFIIWNK